METASTSGTAQRLCGSVGNLGYLAASPQHGLNHWKGLCVGSQNTVDDWLWLVKGDRVTMSIEHDAAGFADKECRCCDIPFILGSKVDGSVNLSRCDQSQRIGYGSQCHPAAG